MVLTRSCAAGGSQAPSTSNPIDAARTLRRTRRARQAQEEEQRSITSLKLIESTRGMKYRGGKNGKQRKSNQATTKNAGDAVEAEAGGSRLDAGEYSSRQAQVGSDVARQPPSNLSGNIDPARQLDVPMEPCDQDMGPRQSNESRLMAEVSSLSERSGHSTVKDHPVGLGLAPSPTIFGHPPAEQQPAPFVNPNQQGKASGFDFTAQSDSAKASAFVLPVFRPTETLTYFAPGLPAKEPQSSPLAFNTPNQQTPYSRASQTVVSCLSSVKKSSHERHAQDVSIKVNEAINKITEVILLRREGRSDLLKPADHFTIMEGMLSDPKMRATLPCPVLQAYDKAIQLFPSRVEPRPHASGSPLHDGTLIEFFMDVARDATGIVAETPKTTDAPQPWSSNYCSPLEANSSDNPSQSREFRPQPMQKEQDITPGACGQPPSFYDPFHDRSLPNVYPNPNRYQAPHQLGRAPCDLPGPTSLTSVNLNRLLNPNPSAESPGFTEEPTGDQGKFGARDAQRRESASSSGVVRSSRGLKRVRSGPYPIRLGPGPSSATATIKQREEGGHHTSRLENGMATPMLPKAPLPIGQIDHNVEKSVSDHDCGFSIRSRGESNSGDQLSAPEREENGLSPGVVNFLAAMKDNQAEIGRRMFEDRPDLSKLCDKDSYEFRSFKLAQKILDSTTTKHGAKLAQQIYDGFNVMKWYKMTCMVSSQIITDKFYGSQQQQPLMNESTSSSMLPNFPHSS